MNPCQSENIVAFDDIHDVVERNKDNLKDKGIIAIKGTKIFYDVYNLLLKLFLLLN